MKPTLTQTLTISLLLLNLTTASPTPNPFTTGIGKLISATESFDQSPNPTQEEEDRVRNVLAGNPDDALLPFTKRGVNDEVEAPKEAINLDTSSSNDGHGVYYDVYFNSDVRGEDQDDKGLKEYLNRGGIPRKKKKGRVTKISG